MARGGQVIDIGRGTTYLAGDSLRVSGPLEKVLALAAQTGLAPHRPQVEGRTNGEANKTILAEIVVLTPSGLIGTTLKDARFAEHYDAIVLALKRRGHVNERPSTNPLHAGDVLLVESNQQALQELADKPGFLVLGTLNPPEMRTGKMAITLLTLLSVVLLVSFGLLPIVTAATAGCAVLMLTGCLRPREVYQAIDMSLVFLLAGSLALGMALEKTGHTALLAKGVAGLTGVTGHVRRDGRVLSHGGRGFRVNVQQRHGRAARSAGAFGGAADGNQSDLVAGGGGVRRLRCVRDADWLSNQLDDLRTRRLPRPRFRPDGTGAEPDYGNPGVGPDPTILAVQCSIAKIRFKT